MSESEPKGKLIISPKALNALRANQYPIETPEQKEIQTYGKLGLSNDEKARIDALAAQGYEKPRGFDGLSALEKVKAIAGVVLATSERSAAIEHSNREQISELSKIGEELGVKHTDNVGINFSAIAKGKDKGGRGGI